MPHLNPSPLARVELGIERAAQSQCRGIGRPGSPLGDGDWAEASFTRIIALIWSSLIPRYGFPLL
jgi:hypothetical protein